VKITNTTVYNSDDIREILTRCRTLAYSLNEGLERTEKIGWKQNAQWVPVVTPRLPTEFTVGYYNRSKPIPEDPSRWDRAWVNVRERFSDIGIVPAKKLYTGTPLMELAQAASEVNTVPQKVVESLCLVFAGWFKCGHERYDSRFATLAESLQLRYSERLTKAQRDLKKKLATERDWERLESMKQNLAYTRREIAYERSKYQRLLDKLEDQESGREARLRKLAKKLGVEVDIDSL
jgi:hypothetical protein